MEKRLRDPDSKHWQPTADFYAKIRGEFAPDKSVKLTISADERKKKRLKRLEEIESGVESQLENGDHIAVLEASDVKELNEG